MPLLSELVSDKATIPVPFGDHTISVTWRPSVFTPGLLTKAKTRGAEAMVNELCALVSAWDLTDESGPVPITPEALTQVPLSILQAVDRAIGREMGLGEPASNSESG